MLQAACQLGQRACHLVKPRFGTTPRSYHQIQSGGNGGSLPTKDLPNQAFPAIAYHRVADAARNGQTNRLIDKSLERP